MRVSISMDGRPAIRTLEWVADLMDDPDQVMEAGMKAASEYMAKYAQSEGRGRWAKLTPSTIERRQRRGGQPGKPRGEQTGAMKRALVIGGPNNIVSKNGTEWVWYPNLKHAWVFAAGRLIPGRKGIRRTRSQLTKAKTGITGGGVQQGRRIIPPTTGEFRDEVLTAAETAMNEWIEKVNPSGYWS